MANITDRAASKLLAQDSKTFGALFLVSFVFLLVVALAAQVLFLEWREWLPGAEGEKSLIKGVKVGVYTFMSHLN
jgi:light-harvesting complex 1 beta chain